MLSSIAETRNPKEIMAAAYDAVALRLGVPVGNPHPLAADISLKDIAYAAGVISRPRQAHEHALAVMGRGLSTTDIAWVMAKAGGALARRIYQAQAEHLKFCLKMPVRDFRESDIPSLDVDLSMKPVGEHGELEKTLVVDDLAATGVRLNIYGTTLAINREVIINDRHEIISYMISSLGASAARAESKMVAAMLDANANMGDGQPVFHADFGNIVTDAFDAAALGSAMGKLRTQVNSFEDRVDLRSKFLVVAPDLELKALKEVKESGLELTVVVLSNLSAGRWFVLADETIQPVVSVLRLRDAETPLLLEAKKRILEFDGIGIKVTADIGGAIISRIGIVRGGA